MEILNTVTVAIETYLAIAIHVREISAAPAAVHRDFSKEKKIGRLHWQFLLKPVGGRETSDVRRSWNNHRRKGLGRCTPLTLVRQFNLKLALSDRDLHASQWRLEKAKIWSTSRLEIRHAMRDLFTICVEGNTYKLAEQYQRSVLILRWR